MRETISGSPETKPLIWWNYYLILSKKLLQKGKWSRLQVSELYGLFGNIYLIRNWGRIGTRGRKLMQSFDTMDEIHQEIRRLLNIRKRRGYNLREHICSFCKKKITRPAKQLRIDGTEIDVCPVCCELI